MKGRLKEFFGLSEGPFGDVERQLGRAQSLRGGPRTEPSVRKHQDRARRYTPDVAKAQSDVDSAQSIFKREAAGDGKSVHLSPKEMSLIVGWANQHSTEPGVQELVKKLQSSMGGESDGDQQSFASPAIPEPNSMARRIG